MYPNTMVVEIHTDKAVRRRISMLRKVPYSPMMNADVTKAAHRLVNVVDATINMIKPRNDKNGRLTRTKKTETNVEVIGYLSKASSTNFVVGATTLSSNFLKASVTDCTLTSNCGQSSSSWSKGAAMFVMEVVRLP